VIQVVAHGFEHFVREIRRVSEEELAVIARE
jgi:hypothetical protein